MERLDPMPIRAIAFVQLQLAQVLSKQGYEDESLNVMSRAAGDTTPPPPPHTHTHKAQAHTYIHIHTYTYTITWVLSLQYLTSSNPSLPNTLIISGDMLLLLLLILCYY